MALLFIVSAVGTAALPQFAVTAVTASTFSAAAQLANTFVALACALGTGLCAWYLLGSALLLLAMRTNSGAIKVLLQRFGPPLLRKALTVSAGGVLVLSPSLSQAAPAQVPTDLPLPSTATPSLSLVVPEPDLSLAHGSKESPSTALPPPSLATGPQSTPVHPSSFVAFTAKDTAKPTYTVRPGDCLWEIANAHGHPEETAQLYQLNAAKIGTNPNLIHPGIALELPKDFK
ncbi:MAG: LysM peptidoglycan-binding domain-containing protein [Actinomycetaceae bacterium]|nr:LysM peptidoglycan-binding domain-containing protein [Actinomycetaceae bacterium]